MRSFAALALLTPLAAAVWPIPSSYTSGDKVLWISSDVQVTYKGVNQSSYGLPLNTSTSAKSNQIVAAAIQRAHDTIFTQNFVPWKFHPRNSNFEPSNSTAAITSITLQQKAADIDDIIRPADGAVDESYTLSVKESGEVTITGNSSIGIAYGLNTFTQLFYKHSKGGAYTPLAPVEIQDAPKFVHRGLNMDTSRNFFPVQDIKRTIDALAYNKFNRLHWHITDAQSWPLEIPSMPDLSAKGAYQADLTYSPSDVKDIQLYGALQGVEVFLEIDQPGHTSSIWFSRPELISAFNVQPNWDTYANEPPSGTFKLNSTAVSAFLEDLFNDLLPRLKPYTSYFHTGGDEVNLNAYKFDDTITVNGVIGSNDTAVLQPLMQKFVDRNHEQVRALGLTPVVWEEMLLVWNLTLGNDVIVQSWLSDESVAAITSQGHKALAGNYNDWYLDCGQGQWIDFTQGAASAKYYPYADYCSPRKNWRLIYSYDPLSGVAANATSLVLGGEVHAWAEQIDPVNLDRQVWPRAAAAGEVLWSGAKDASGQNRSQVTAAPRLSEMRERLVAKGVMAEPIQMPFCLMNGTQCALDH